MNTFESESVVVQRAAVPVTVLTGFRGAGKTTLLNRILTGDYGLRIALLVNDFGSINIGAELVMGAENDSSLINLRRRPPERPAEDDGDLPVRAATARRVELRASKGNGGPENSMIYSADMGVGKVAGITLDQATGEMNIVFVIENPTSGFQPLLGPKDQRVLLLSHVKRRVTDEPLKQAVFTGNYTEQVTWRDAATGRLIAESDFFEPMTLGSLITPGFGGRVYFDTGKGFISMQVMPAAGTSSSK